MNCKNCQKPLAESDKFCRDCGAKVIDHRITMGHIAAEMKSGFFSIDSSKPVKTFTDMFIRPEVVIDGYIDGTRKKFIHAFGYFTIAIIFSSFFYFIALNFFPESMDAAFEMYSQGEEQQEAVSRIQKKIFEYQSVLFYVFIPIMALISYIVFYNKKKYNYAEHLIFNLYSYSQLSIVTIILFFATIWSETIFPYVQLISMFLQIGLYSYFAARVFKLSFKQVVIKIIYFLGIFFFLYFGIIVLFIIIILVTGNVDILKSMAIPPPSAVENTVSYIASSTINWTS